MNVMGLFLKKIKKESLSHHKQPWNGLNELDLNLEGAYILRTREPQTVTHV